MPAEGDSKPQGSVPAPAAPAAPAAGGAAILARLRAQRAAAAASTADSTATAPDTAAAVSPDANCSPAAASPAAPAAKTPAAAAPGPVTATGGAAILARLRAQRAAKAAPAKAPAKEVVVVYASQTGTAQEIAKNIQAEAEQKGIKGRVLSMNEFGFDNLNPKEAPVLIYVASSTGDGDAPDNAAKFYATLRRKSHPDGLLKGIAFTGFGLGDSNYTRYQYVPRAVRTRLLSLGAAEFYPAGEADEVDGIEEGLDKWLEGLWPALKAAVAPEGVPADTAADSPDAPAAEAELAGVPPLPRCRVRLVWQERGVAAAAVEGNATVGAAAAAAAPVPPQLEFRNPTAAELAYRDPEGHYSAEQPFWAPVTEACWLTTDKSDADRQVLHVELDVSGSGMAFGPGDAIGVLPQNDAGLVSALLERLGLDGEAVFDVRPAEDDAAAAAAGSSAVGAGDGSTAGSAGQAGATGANAAGSTQHHSDRLLPHLRAPCSVRAALTAGVDLTGPPRKSLLRVLGEHCAEPAERRRLLHLCSRDGRDAYAADILAARPTLLDLLAQFPSCRPPLDALLDALPPLAARMYSLTNSPLASPERVQVAFTIVRYSTDRFGERQGVATSWLNALCAPLASSHSSADGSAAAGQVAGSGAANGAAAAAPIRLPVFLRRGGAFGPPESLATPLLMIGPGTGVAPFRGFLQHRRAQAAAQVAAAQGGGGGEGAAADKGAAWLFFGCRREDQDFLYKDDLQGFVADGTLDRLCVAFSRAQADKVYVQHLMQQHAEELHNLIAKQGARVYVCGDGAAMAKDVHACLQSILAQQGGLSEAEAAEQLAVMTRQGRYVRDIWS